MPINLKEFSVDTENSTVRMVGVWHEEGTQPYHSQLEIDIVMPLQVGPNSDALQLIVNSLKDMLEEECSVRFEEFRQTGRGGSSDRPTIELSVNTVEPFIRRIGH